VAWSDPASLLLHTDAVVRNMLPLDKRIVASIDAAFCHFDAATGTITFAGAHQSLFWTDGTLCEEICGGRRSLNDRKRGTYVNVTRTVAPTHTYYLVSDGLLDQAGGADGHSFGNQRLRDWILQHAHLPLTEQRQRLIETIDAYRAACPQRDDITLLGFRLP
jgi:serine phosphatase RsbU (regulator of sigma subunit)